MASGIHIDEQCQHQFKEMKLGHKIPYIVYKISDDKKMVCVDKVAEAGENYSHLQAYLQEMKKIGKCRWAVADIQVKSKSGQDTNKLIYIQWNPDDAGIKEKMIYTSSNDALKRALGDGFKAHQANDDDELELSVIVEKLS
jgi:cofilin